MANTFAPFGFQHVGYIDGHAPNYANTEKLVAQGNATQIFAGDPVTQLNTGYVTRSTAGTTQIHGVFLGCNYLASAGGVVYSRYWPGSGAASDATCQVISDPTALFLVQANGQTTQAMEGQNIQFALGTGNVSTQGSGAYVDTTTVATTNTLPFRVWKLYTYGAPGANGSDQTTPYGYMLVTYNNQDFKSLTGI